MNVRLGRPARAALGLGITATAGLWFAYRHDWTLRGEAWPGRRQLAGMLAPLRPGPGRWVGLAYAPQGGGRLPKPADLPELRRLAARLSRTAGEPQPLADLALVELTMDRPRTGVAALEEAAALAPRDPRFASDLAAAQLALAARTERPLDLVLALDAASRALRLDPRFQPALTNLAEALDRLGLTEQGHLAWQRLQALDGTSGWGREAAAALARGGRAEAEDWARIRRQLVEQPAAAGTAVHAALAAAVARFAQQLRTLGEEDLLVAWAGRRDRGAAEGDAGLRLARAIGEVLAERHGDWMLHDSVAVADAAASDLHGAPARRGERLASGYLAFGRARALYEDGDVAQAAPWFAWAQEDLAAAGSPFTRWADLYGAICDYYAPNRAAALARLQRLAQSPGEDRYPTLAGRVLWMIGLIHFDAGDWSGALAAYRAALLHFQGCREPENEAAVENLMAVVFDYLGDEESAWHHRMRALALLPRVLDARRQVNILGAAARSLAGLHPEAALWFADRNAAVAIAAANPQVATVGLWQRALVEHAGGNDAPAAADLARAREQVSSVPDPRVRSQQTGDIDLAAGLVTSAGSPRIALANLDQALAAYRNEKSLFVVPEILRQEARLYLTLGEDASAARVLRQGIEAIEAVTGQLSDEELGRSYVLRTLDIYDEMARLQVAGMRDPAAGFAYAERRRAVQLRLIRGAGDGTPQASSSGQPDVAASLEPGTALVEYLVAGDELITFVVRRETGIQALAAEHEGPALTRLSTALLEAAGNGSAEPDLHGALAELGQRLLGRLAPALAGAGRIVFIPDKALYAVPFAALVEPRSGSYLVERHRVVVAASAVAFGRRATAAAPPTTAPPSRVLLVGDPAFNPVHFPGLPRLPAARAEVEDLRRLYPGSTLLNGTLATRSAFLSALPRAELVQFSGHAVVHPQLPARSALVLADDSATAPGALFARELAGLSLPRTRLVVLAACGTGSGSLNRSDGVADLARPFFAAGVPEVIATLWNVEDASAARLSRALHRRLAAGVDAESALRGAQLELLHGAEPRLRSPAAWAPFQLLRAAGAGYSRAPTDP